MLGSGGIRRGLHIDDDDQEKPKYEKQSIEADRKRTKFENNLDDMLFGGPRRKTTEKPPAADNLNKSNDSKSADKVVVNVVAGNTGQNNANNQNTNKIPGSNNSPNTSTKVVVPTTGSTTTQNQGSKTVVQNQIITQVNKVSTSDDPSRIINTNISVLSKTKVQVTQTQTVVTNHKKQPSIFVPTPNPPAQSKKDISSIGLETKKNINTNINNPSPPATTKVNNYVQPPQNLQPVQPVQPGKPLEFKPAKPKVQQKLNKNQPQVTKSVPQQKGGAQKGGVVIAQPAKQQEAIDFEQKLTGVSFRNLFNKPQYVRKLKKIAEDFKFSDENVALHSSIDVVRPFETDRNRQKKLNDFDFKDYQFPSSSFSLGAEHKNTSSVWKKPKELAKVVNFGKYIDPNDLNPGVLSGPHFVSTLSALAEFQINTKRLIEDQKSNQNGFYLVRLFINSVWRYVTVDNALPFINNDNAGVLSNTDSEFELSSALIEKAYAKSFGGYDVFSRVQPRENILRDLTGAPTKKYSIANPDLNNIIKKALSQGQIVLAVPNEKLAALGANPNFSYIVINSTSKGSLQLRNSFGSTEQRSKISFKAEGTFQLSSSQVKDVLSHVIISQIHIDYNTATIQSKHRTGFYSSYNFNIKKAAHGFLTVSQWDSRLFPSHSHYQYSPFHIVLVKTENDGSSTYVNAGFTSGQRNLDLQVNLAPGSYTVFVNGNWFQEQHSYNLTFYGSDRVDFQRVYNERVPNLISHSLEHLNIEHGTRSDLSKTSARYIHYHPESNLVLLTIQNTSDRASNVTADLSRVKLDSLALLSSHNNEDNYSNKVGSEVDEYKQYPLHDKRWTVNVQGNQAFTWIFSTNEAYSEGNLKRWGF